MEIFSNIEFEKKTNVDFELELVVNDPAKRSGPLWCGVWACAETVVQLHNSTYDSSRHKECAEESVDCLAHLLY